MPAKLSLIDLDITYRLISIHDELVEYAPRKTAAQLPELRGGVADGSELWRYQTGGAIYSAPEIVDGVIYIGSLDHFIYALRTQDGSVLWRYQTGDAVASLPTVSDSVLYTGSSDGFVCALRTQDGSVLWRYQTGGAISSKAILADGIVYIGGSNGLFALQANNGSLAWKCGDAAFTTPTLAF
ncbi:MAG: PQQ-binding-like beta-propeller repeat protein [Ktedonobacteraceae bacterium]